MRARVKSVTAASSVARTSALVLLGSSLGFGINLLLTPAISRLYSPGEFGLSASVIAASSMCVGMSTLRFEVFAQSSASESEARSFFVLAGIWSTLVSLGATAIAGAAVVWWGTSPWWLACGPLILMSTWQLIGSGILTRRSGYEQLAAQNFVQGASQGLIQAVLGVTTGGVGSLLAGQALSRSAWVLTFGRVLRSEGAGLLATWRRSWRRGGLAGLSALVNSTATQALPLLVGALVGQPAVGLVAMATRLLVAPLAIVSQAVAAASVGHVGRLVRTGSPEEAMDLVRRGILRQALLGLVPCGLAAALMPRLAAPLLGPQWGEAGTVIAAMALGALAQFAVSPFAQILNVMGRSGELLSWDVQRLVVLVVSLAVPSWLGWSLAEVMVAYSAGQVINYVSLRRVLLNGRRQTRSPLGRRA